MRNFDQECLVCTRKRLLILCIYIKKRQKEKRKRQNKVFVLANIFSSSTITLHSFSKLRDRPHQLSLHRNLELTK